MCTCCGSSVLSHIPWALPRCQMALACDSFWGPHVRVLRPGTTRGPLNTGPPPCKTFRMAIPLDVRICQFANELEDLQNELGQGQDIDEVRKSLVRCAVLRNCAFLLMVSHCLMPSLPYCMLCMLRPI